MSGPRSPVPKRNRRVNGTLVQHCRPLTPGVRHVDQDDAVDTVPERMAMAKAAGAEVLDFMKEDIYDRSQELTSGRGADAASTRSAPSRTRPAASIPSLTAESGDFHGH